jgi:hypothetical protein
MVSEIERNLAKLMSVPKRVPQNLSLFRCFHNSTFRNALSHSAPSFYIT